VLKGTTLRIFGAVLAGGEARRMGGVDKALVPFAGKSLIAHVLDRLEPQVEEVLISANGDASRFAQFGCKVVADDLPQGPLSGVLACLKQAAAMGATHLVTTPVDTPFIPGDLVPQLLLAAESATEGLAMARDDQQDHPATAVWPVGLADALAAYLAEGGRKVTGFTKAHGAVTARFPDARAFMNLNTPEDLVQAEAWAKGAA
jgi:molybdopterin-guanine dinucleotide biosynthesis protein A